MTKKPEHIGLLGNPNCGKSTLFNGLTGLRQKTSNLPGTTVEQRTGKWKAGENWVQLTDLPGIYSLYSQADDEKVVIRHLLGAGGAKVPDKIIFVFDAGNIRRNLLLFSQVAELGIPICGAVSMLDLADKKGHRLDIAKLSDLLGIPVVAVSPNKGTGLEQLPGLLDQCRIPSFQIHADDAKNRLLEFYNVGKTKGIAEQTLGRYKYIEQLVKSCVTRVADKRTITQLSLDRLFTHRFWGYAIFAFIMLLIFQGVFTLAEYPMGWIEQAFVNISDYTLKNLPRGHISEMLARGLIPGIAGVLAFVPQIAVLFLFIGFLEDSGYMVRASFITDKIMRRVGLSGRSVIPLLGGFACAIPSIMATRTIRNPAERLATMFIIPLMSCSARLPVYTLLVSLAIPSKSAVGPFNLQAFVMTAAYFSGIAVAAVVAWIFKVSGKKTMPSELILEMPAYQMPRLGNVLMQVWHKCRSFIAEAGKIIVIISVVLWYLSNNGPGNDMEMARTESVRTMSKGNLFSQAEIESHAATAELEASYAGRIGKLIEPVIAPLGYDWKTGIAIVTSVAAREVFVGTMSTLYSQGDENLVSIRDKMKASVNPETGRPVYGVPYALSLMIFYAFALQCMSTIAVMRRETGGWKWPAFQFAAFTALAWIAAFIVFHLSSYFFK